MFSRLRCFQTVCLRAHVPRLQRLRRLLVPLPLHFLSGAPSLGLQLVPGCTLEDGVHVQRALVRTISMLCAFTSILLFSHVASWLFHSGLLPQCWDMFGVKASHSPAPPVVVDGG